MDNIKLAEVEQRCKSNTKRLDKMDKEIEDKVNRIIEMELQKRLNG